MILDLIPFAQLFQIAVPLAPLFPYITQDGTYGIDRLVQQQQLGNSYARPRFDRILSCESGIFVFIWNWFFSLETNLDSAKWITKYNVSLFMLIKGVTLNYQTRVAKECYLYAVFQKAQLMRTSRFSHRVRPLKFTPRINLTSQPYLTCQVIRNM